MRPFARAPTHPTQNIQIQHGTSRTKLHRPLTALPITKQPYPGHQPQRYRYSNTTITSKLCCQSNNNTRPLPPTLALALDLALSIALSLALAINPNYNPSADSAHFGCERVETLRNSLKPNQKRFKPFELYRNLGVTPSSTAKTTTKAKQKSDLLYTVTPLLPTTKHPINHLPSDTTHVSTHNKPHKTQPNPTNL